MTTAGMMEATRSGRALVWWGLGIAVLFWILESALDGLLFRGDGFLRELLVPPLPELWMRLLIFGLLVAFGWYAHHVARALRNQNAQERALARELGEALEQVRILSGLLPVCAHCRKVEADPGTWLRLEDYLRTRSDTQFSHGMCPDCGQTFYGSDWGGKKEHEPAPDGT